MREMRGKNMDKEESREMEKGCREEQRREENMTGKDREKSCERDQQVKHFLHTNRHTDKLLQK